MSAPDLNIHMQRGPKLKNPNTKKLAGTYRDAIDGTTAPIVQLVEDTPVAPAWLSAGAKKVWADDLARVVACGAREPHSENPAWFGSVPQLRSRRIVWLALLLGDCNPLSHVLE